MSTERTPQQMERLRAGLARRTGTSDESIIDELVDLNFSSSTVGALSIVPLVAVAWADGEVDANEREAVLAYLDEADAPPGSRRALERLLSHKPEDRFVKRCLKVLHAIYETMPPTRAARARRDLVNMAMAVGETTGGFLGLFGDRLSTKEEAVIAAIATRLEVSTSVHSENVHSALLSGHFASVAQKT